MAKVYGKHSRYVSKILQNQNDNMAITFILFVTFASGFFGYALASSWNLIFLFVPLVIIGFLVVKYLFEEITKGRQNAFRGFDGEQIVTELLCELPNDYYIFNGIVPNGYGDIDHVVVGPCGVVVIETKNTKGWITSSGNKLFLNQRGVEGDPIMQVLRNGMALKERLDKMMLCNSGFKSYVCFPNCHVEGHIDIKKVTVVSRDKIEGYIKGLPHKFHKADILRYKRALEELVKETASKPVVTALVRKGGLKSVAGVGRR